MSSDGDPPKTGVDTTNKSPSGDGQSSDTPMASTEECNYSPEEVASEFKNLSIHQSRSQQGPESIESDSKNRSIERSRSEPVQGSESAPLRFGSILPDELMRLNLRIEQSRSKHVPMTSTSEEVNQSPELIGSESKILTIEQSRSDPVERSESSRSSFRGIFPDKLMAAPETGEGEGKIVRSYKKKFEQERTLPPFLSTLDWLGEPRFKFLKQRHAAGKRLVIEMVPNDMRGVYWRPAGRSPPRTVLYGPDGMGGGSRLVVGGREVEYGSEQSGNAGQVGGEASGSGSHGGDAGGSGTHESRRRRN